MKIVKVTDTTLRDGHQSLWATRMKTEDMIPILRELDEVGYHSLEVWGGATFDVCMRYLQEDPWERLRIIKKHVRKTPLQMLLRGQSLVGYQHYPDDVVEAFIGKAVENGINIIRIFDALNDLRNLKVPMHFTKEAGAHVQAAVVYTISPVHTVEHYLEIALRLEDMGADSICIKDMAGLLTPFQAREMVKIFKKRIKLPLQLHTHYIGGMAVGACLKAAEAGVDVIDCATLPLAFGPSQPPVETVVRALSETPYSTRLNIHQLFDIARYFEDLRKKLGYKRGVTRLSDMQVFDHQVPGGMITNLVSQLEEQKALHRIDEVLREIPRVREEMGYPPLVTPTSQIIGIQAVLNVLRGERYKVVPNEVKAYVRGLYGTPPAPIREDLKKIIVGDSEIINCRPADLLQPMLEKAREEIAGMAESEEDVISYALFPQVARKFFEYRKDLREGKITPVPKGDSMVSPGIAKEDKNMKLEDVKELVRLMNETDISELHLESEGLKITLRKGETGTSNSGPNATSPVAAVNSVSQPVPTEPQTKAKEEVNPNLVPIVAPMVGTFYRAPAPDAPAFVELGSQVKAGQTVCIIEAMKLMNEIEAEVDGRIAKILVENGQPVEYGQTLFLIEMA